jgi:Tfp pilus assembly pilus retraction ATPase PilT
MILTEILKKSLDDNVSDIILSTDSKPCFKINGEIIYLDEYEILSNSELSKELSSIMNNKQKNIFKEKLELDFSIELK